jgi:hypothetical protein
VIKDIDVSLRGVYHETPSQLGMLLVGPAGQNVMLMDGGCGLDPVRGANWRWDDEAPQPTSGGGCGANDVAFRPSSNASSPPAPSPAPSGPYGTSLSGFDGTDPNGEWRLYVFDRTPAGGDGFFVERFTLQIETRAKAQTALTQAALELAEGEAGELALRREADGQVLGQGAVMVVATPLDATLGGDFEPVSGTLEFAPGVRDLTVPLRTLADTTPEGPETFEVTLSQPSGDVALASPATTVVTIRDDDGDRAAPETTLRRAPKGTTTRARAKLRFVSSEPGSTFECKLDGRGFKPCASPRTLKRLRDGRHRFAVRAIDAAGNADPTPATRRWRVR